ncbi:MAG TPA: hypothetical protein PKD68_04530 [Candidatus Saccharibacteria bacterium]|nr:hypothetical protein [Candidatus Saccharibacteria bacterium]
MNNETPENNSARKSLNLDMASLTTLVMPVAKFIRRHLVIFFITLTLSALIYAVLSVNTALQEAGAPEDASAATYNTNFDRTTISKINNLNGASQTPTVTLPEGRINPFAE